MAEATVTIAIPPTVQKLVLRVESLASICWIGMAAAVVLGRGRGVPWLVPVATTELTAVSPGPFVRVVDGESAAVPVVLDVGAEVAVAITLFSFSLAFGGKE